MKKFYHRAALTFLPLLLGYGLVWLGIDFFKTHTREQVFRIYKKYRPEPLDDQKTALASYLERTIDPQLFANMSSEQLTRVYAFLRDQFDLSAAARANLISCVYALAQKDPAKLLASWQTEMPAFLTAEEKSILYGLLAHHDDRVLTALLGQQPATVRAWFCQEFLSHLAKNDPARAFRLIPTHGQPLLDLENVVLKEWMKKNPETCCQHLMQHPVHDFSQNLTAALNTWLKQEPEKAWAWFMTHHQSLLEVPVFLSTWGYLMEATSLTFTPKMWDDMRRLADQTTDKSLKLRLHEAFAQLYGGTNLPAAWDYAQKLESHAGKERALKSLSLTAARQNPDQAIAWAQEQALSPSLKREISRTAIEKLSLEKSPEELLAWARQQSDYYVRKTALREIIRTWHQNDPLNAAANIITIENETERRFMTRELISHYQHDDRLINKNEASQLTHLLNRLPAQEKNEAITSIPENLRTFFK
jgi:hypothetical protein